MDRETLERLVREILEELDLDYHVFDISPERESSAWVIEFSGEPDDVRVTRDPGEDEEAIKNKIRQQLT